jgi:multidrug efflux pump
MSLSDFCLRRPVFAAVLSLLVIVLGLVSLGRLPVRELPDIDAATVTVDTTWRGAAPEVVNTQLTEPVERAIAGVSGVRQIVASSELGRSRVVVEFVTGRDIDAAANDVRGAVGRIVNQLPDEADEPRIFKNDSNADPVMRLSILSDRLSASEITDYVKRFLIDRLATLDGVASVSVFGERGAAIRVALDPRAMAARGITAADVENALRDNNLELPAGEVVSRMRLFQVRAETRLTTVEDFRDLTIRVVDGTPVRVGDVAEVFLGVENEDTLVRSVGRTAVGLGILRQSQANTIAISDGVRAELDRLRPSLPEGMEIVIGSDDAAFIRASIDEVTMTLVVAVLLVVAVIFVFLGSPRATLVPAVAIPVSIVGSFIGLYAFGFSINILTLFALILAIGIVVDDAIVVLETCQHRIERGEPPLAAAARGSREVGFAVIATSVTLVSVFVPISFLEGQVGRLFTEFGIVLAVAVGFSTFVALTICPVLCWLLLRKGSGGVLERAVVRGTGLLERGYRRVLRGCLSYPIVVLAGAAAFGGVSGWLWLTVPRELTPQEDRGVFFVSVAAPQGATVQFTDREARAVEARLAPLLERGLAQQIVTVVGTQGDRNRAFVVVRLTDWAARDVPSQRIVRELIPELAGVPGARVFPVQPSGLGLRGGGAPLQVKVQGPDFETAAAWAATLRAALEANAGLQNVDTDYQLNQPELRVDVDRAMADDLGISIAEIGATLQTFFASREVTGYVDRGREYPVILQASADSRRTAADLDVVNVRSRTTGELVPLSALLTVREGTASPELNRFDRLPAVELTASLTAGYDLGRAIDFVRTTAAETLPPEARIAFAGQSRQYLDASRGALVTFAFALVIVYLVLAAQFESWIDPVTILLTAPLALTGALGTIWLSGQSLNVFTQIGMILLIGLMAKNGILIVEYANQLRDRGASVREAALEGSVRRLRPILMTVLSTLLGAAPLVWSSGAGSESRAAIGIVILGGFGVSSLFTLLVTPVLYDLLARLTRPRAAAAEDMERALGGG